MNKNRFIFSLILLAFTVAACVDVEPYDNSQRGNFEALWKIMDEHYCFFEYKNIDWEQIHTQYAAKISENMSDVALFDTLSLMLQELEDGHVNLYSSWDIGRYWKWYEDYPTNFDTDLIYNPNYLGTNYRIAGSARCTMLKDSIGYMYYGDFSGSLSENNLDYIFAGFAKCPGIIIDVRNNGGGYLSISESLASRLTNEKILVGYIQHKTGKGHNDFSTPYPKYIEPSERIRYLKPIVVLTNRKCFSATNDFVNAVRMFPNVTILGDRTGGGGGLPFSSELPNGWAVRFSACPSFDANKEQIEFGIDPDIHVDLLPDDAANGYDTLIEAARELLKKNAQ